MKEIKFDHVFNCNEDIFWDQVFFDDEYNRAVFLEGLKFPGWRVESSDKTETTIRRVLDVKPPTGDIPGAVRKVIGDNLSYKEVGTFDRKTKRYRVEVQPSTAREKTNVTGEIWAELVDDKHCRRLATFRIECRVFMIGGIIEDLIAKGMTQQFNQGATISNEWIAKKGL